MLATIQELDRLIEWGARKRIISGGLLIGFQKVLKQIAEAYTQLDSKLIKSELDVQELIGKLDKTRRICRLSGMSEKTIEKLLEIQDDFIYHYPYTVQSDTDFRILLQQNRMVYLKSDLDMSTLKIYEKIWKMGESKHSYLQFYRDMSPHLLPFFDLIEKGATTNYENARIFLIQHHILN